MRNQIRQNGCGHHVENMVEWDFNRHGFIVGYVNNPFFVSVFPNIVYIAV